MITIITCTGRTNPRFDILADGIYQNAKSIDPTGQFLWFNWLVIDMKLWYYEKERRQELESAVKGRFSFEHHPPKPTTWQGPTRLTKADYFALCSARNTGLCLSKFNYVVFLDDCLLPDQGWLEWHLHGARNKVSMAGSYESIQNAVITDGQLVSCNRLPESMMDHRVKVVGPDIAMPIKSYGAWLYGLNMGFPLKMAFKVNGFDEKYDGQGGSEDTDMGVRLERVGTLMYFNPSCKIYQILDTHEAVCDTPGFNKLLGATSTRKQKELPLRHDGKMHYANEKLIENLLQDEPMRYTTSKDSSDIIELRKLAMQGKRFPIPKEPKMDWRDGQMLSEMF